MLMTKYNTVTKTSVPVCFKIPVNSLFNCVEKATGLGCFDRMSFDHCAHHRGDQRCVDAMAHYIANTNGGRLFVKPCDMKEIAAHQHSREIPMTKTELGRLRGGVCRKSRIRARHECLLQFRRH